MNKLHKSVLIGIGALALSTVAIQASDMLRGIEGNLAGMVSESENVCGKGAVLMLFGSHSLCVDTYEASANEACPNENPQNSLQTQENANEPTCAPSSEEGVLPWRFVSLTQAQQLCARAGKRLPTSEEWYKIASGFTDHASCNIASAKSEPSPTGEFACMTSAGIADVIGNVWEWVDEEVVEGTYNGRAIPQSGYVALVDSDGVVVETALNASAEFGSDYAWTDHRGVRGIIRGGFYGSGEDAGIFAQNLSVPLDFKTTGVGFRCVKDR